MSGLRHCQRLEGMLAPVVLALHQHKNVGESVKGMWLSRDAFTLNTNIGFN